MPQNDVGIEISSWQHGNMRNVPSCTHEIAIDSFSHEQATLARQSASLKGCCNESRLGFRQLNAFKHLDLTCLKLQAKRHSRG